MALLSGSLPRWPCRLLHRERERAAHRERGLICPLLNFPPPRYCGHYLAMECVAEAPSELQVVLPLSMGAQAHPPSLPSGAQARLHVGVLMPSLLHSLAVVQFKYAAAALVVTSFLKNVVEYSGLTDPVVPAEVDVRTGEVLTPRSGGYPGFHQVPMMRKSVVSSKRHPQWQTWAQGSPRPRPSSANKTRAPQQLATNGPRASMHHASMASTHAPRMHHACTPCMHAGADDAQVRRRLGLRLRHRGEARRDQRRQPVALR